MARSVLERCWVRFGDIDLSRTLSDGRIALEPQSRSSRDGVGSISTRCSVPDKHDESLVRLRFHVWVCRVVVGFHLPRGAQAHIDVLGGSLSRVLAHRARVSTANGRRRPAYVQKGSPSTGSVIEELLALDKATKVDVIHFEVLDVVREDFAGGRIHDWEVRRTLERRGS